tara:strand:+ start:888 stop:1559 length:672 start_codon:yes stop_codon:yes gene_type:complete
MEKVIQGAQGKKKVNKITTFPVPFKLEGIQENITIATYTSDNPSKEKILNQAFKFHSQGNILEAAKNYQKFIDKGFKDHRVFSNYGIILKDHGKLEEAELSTRKAIDIKPDFAYAHYNLGNILSDLGKLEEAIFSQQKAIKLKPDFANAYSNLGAIFLNLGKLEEAHSCYKKALYLNKNLDEATEGIGEIHLRKGDFHDGIFYLRKANGSINFNYTKSHFFIN